MSVRVGMLCVSNILTPNHMKDYINVMFYLPGSYTNKKTLPISWKCFSYYNNVSSNYIRNPSNIPAATAEPITPATFGPMACINR